MNAQILIKISDRVVRGDRVICNFNPVTKDSCNILGTRYNFVNLNSNFFRRPPHELILTKTLINVWLLVLCTIYSSSILLKIEKRQQL